MNEKNTKELVKKSLIKTSEGFTEEFMNKLQEQKTAPPVRVNWLSAVAAYLAVGFLGLLASQLLWDNTFLTGTYKRPFQTLLSLFLLLSFYGFFQLKKMANLLRK